MKLKHMIASLLATSSCVHSSPLSDDDVLSASLDGSFKILRKGAIDTLPSNGDNCGISGKLLLKSSYKIVEQAAKYVHKAPDAVFAKYFEKSDKDTRDFVLKSLNEVAQQAKSFTNSNIVLSCVDTKNLCETGNTIMFIQQGDTKAAGIICPLAFSVLDFNYKESCDTRHIYRQVGLMSIAHTGNPNGLGFRFDSKDKSRNPLAYELWVDVFGRQGCDPATFDSYDPVKIRQGTTWNDV